MESFKRLMEQYHADYGLNLMNKKTGRKTRANFQNVLRTRTIDLSLTPVEPVTRQINTRSINFKVECK